MTASVQVRPIRPADYDRVGDIVVDAYRPYFRTLGSYEGVLRDVAGRAARVEVLVAEVDGQVVGTTTYVPGPGEDSDFGERPWASIRMLAVSPEARGMGIGRTLVDACLERARRDGRKFVGLHTGSEMAAAQSMYQGYGFLRLPELDFDDDVEGQILAYRLDLEA